MEAPSPQQLETLKYSDLQRLAKSAGLKANLKADKLLNVLKQHFCEPINENGNMVSTKKASSYTDAEECDSSPIPVNLSMVTKRRRKHKDNKALKNPKGKNVHEEKTEVHSEKEILTELKENKETQDSGNTLNVIQNECLTNSRMAEILAENSATPSLQHEKDSTIQKRAENKTLTDSFSGKRPCYTGSVSKPARTKTTTTTPNFKKIHEAQFKKMQSIDDYIEKKKKMIHNFSNSVNEDKVLAKKSNYRKTSQNEMLNSHSKTRSRGILLSPLPQKNMLSATCTPVNLRRSPRNSLGTANKSILSRKSAFNSTGLSETKMNVRFSESTTDNEHKRSLTKTPSRKSPFLNYGTPDSQKSNKSVTRKDIKGSTTKCQLTETPINSAVTPFKFVTQTEEPTSTKKPIFDLQASLSRPLSYQPHRGKLKPWGKSKENHQNICSHKRDYKQPLLQTREERREKHAQGRKQRKDQVLGTRRGLRVV
ncbi:nucleolar and spindle-associated protein 1 [Elgaria multicarinata webbii]|uniref:nucleolar and spindle-associated protein 1 n=1 Tax=Elgaria multicarinata webbii TaxID=159646 RepID=UPI002FCD5D64